MSAVAVLLAAPGTSCPQAQAALDAIGRAAARRAPGVMIRWAFTSGGVRRKLAAQGRPAPDPAEALAVLRAAGATRVAVLPLHLVDGMEFAELAGTAAEFESGAAVFDRVVVGTPLLASEGGYRRALAAFLAGLPPRATDEAAVLVAHGSRDPQGARTFAAAAARSLEVEERCFLGMIIGEPGKDAVIAACRAAAVRKVWLAPFTVAAGQGTRDDIAGAGPGSWRSALERAGLACETRMTGLAEVPGAVEVWMDELARLLAELR